MKTRLIILFLSISILVNAQEVKYFAINSISSGVLAGLGSGINKNKGEAFIHAFKNGFWKGCAGGVVNYSAKELLRIDGYSYVWPARILNSLGNSMAYNGMKNKPLLSSFYFTLYFANLEYDGKLHCKIDPVTIGSTVFLSLKSNMSFDFNTTVKTGSIVFNRSIDDIQIDNYHLTIFGISGQCFGNTLYSNKYSQSVMVALDFLNIDVNDKINKYIETTIKHEIVHSFQYEQFNFSYTFDWKLTKYLNVNPYFSAIYLINSISKYNYYEKEADYFGKSNF